MGEIGNTGDFSGVEGIVMDLRDGWRAFLMDPCQDGGR